MILIVIADKNRNLDVAGAVATALCAVGITQPFPGGLPFRPAEGYGGSIELRCDESDLLRAKAGFVANGFSVLGAPSRDS
jgi:hypothetical protein